MVRGKPLTAALEALYGPGTAVAARVPVSGGDINRAWRLELTGGQTVFCKTNAGRETAFFRAEAEGLWALGRTGAIGVPAPLALGPEGGGAYLLLEHLEPGPAVREYWETFGRELAALHRADTAGLTGTADRPYGLAADNFIGLTPQENGPMESWTAFFRDRRLAPQMARAERWLDRTLRKKCGRLLDRLGDHLPEPAFPSLLHGDLWSGNQGRGPDGKAWIYDPAVYVGHYEADLAMTELFGGFPPAFYGAYREVTAPEPGYRDRREIYNLYHLLNHLNLFGGSYLPAVAAVLERYG